MFKRKAGIIAAVLCTLFLLGCTMEPKLSEDPIVFEWGSNGEYSYLSWDGRIYVPYCAAGGDNIGDCIGYYDYPEDELTEEARIYIYEFKDFSPNEWLIEFDPVSKESMVLRELDAVNVPDGLTGEYDWNK